MKKIECRLGETNYNKQGSLMRIVSYDNHSHIVVEFQDEYKMKVNTRYDHFIKGTVRNPYDKNVYGVGMIGSKYSSVGKEYRAWSDMIKRSYSEAYKLKKPVYKDVTCCDEWLLFENFYEWIHKQNNFEQWLNGKQWNVDKDILIKGNKIYSPDTCCLVPQNVNKLFIKSNASRGKYPIGTTYIRGKYQASCCSPITGIHKFLGYFNTPEEAFCAYQNYKENLIKQIAKEEYNKNNITKQCYDAMMNYQVEITD